MNYRNTVIFLFIVMFISLFLFASAIVNLKGRNIELQNKLREGVISTKKIDPEIRLTTDGKTIDTLYIYKPQ